uniref:Caveolin n=1 Tax=Magallana gigas TaxID=29159 RepID=A0A8W8LTA1_MAGGI
MTDAQELLAHVIVDPNDHDPEKRMESFNELIDFENIFVEPPDLQSCDIVWFCSNLTFQATKNRVYYSQRFWFCILAAVWGIAFAVTSYLETFCCRPITEMIRLIAKIPGPRKCVLIYTRCFKQVCFGCFIDEDEDEKMETKSV